jgi:hypothetical protein
MPVFAALTKNTMLDALSLATLSLHTAYDAAGGNEVIGGVPPYVRLPVTFAPAALGKRALTGTPYTFSVPACTLAWVGFWDVSGTFQGMSPIGLSAPRPFAVDDLVANDMKSAGHAFVVGDTLVVWQGSAGVLPVPLFEGVIYYVVTATPNSLQLSLTFGGPPVTLTVVGNGHVHAIAPVVFPSQGTYSVSALVLDATVAA